MLYKQHPHRVGGGTGRGREGGRAGEEVEEVLRCKEDKYVQNKDEERGRRL